MVKKGGNGYFSINIYDSPTIKESSIMKRSSDLQPLQLTNDEIKQLNINSSNLRQKYAKIYPMLPYKKLV